MNEPWPSSRASSNPARAAVRTSKRPPRRRAGTPAPPARRRSSPAPRRRAGSRLLDRAACCRGRGTGSAWAPRRSRDLYALKRRTFDRPAVDIHQPPLLLKAAGDRGEHRQRHRRERRSGWWRVRCWSRSTCAIASSPACGGVDQHRDVDAVAGHERQPFEQLPPRGDLAGQRLAHRVRGPGRTARARPRRQVVTRPPPSAPQTPSGNGRGRSPSRTTLRARTRADRADQWRNAPRTPPCRRPGSRPARPRAPTARATSRRPCRARAHGWASARPPARCFHFLYHSEHAPDDRRSPGPAATGGA